MRPCEGPPWAREARAIDKDPRTRRVGRLPEPAKGITAEAREGMSRRPAAALCPLPRAVHGSGASAPSLATGSQTRGCAIILTSVHGLAGGAAPDAIREAMPIGHVGLPLGGAENVVSLLREGQAWGGPSRPSVARTRLCVASKRPLGQGGRRALMASPISGMCCPAPPRQPVQRWLGRWSQ
jgi:hypothetical protein